MVEKLAKEYRITLCITDNKELHQILSELSEQKDIKILYDNENVYFTFDTLDYYAIKNNDNLFKNSLFISFLKEIDSIKNYGINNKKRKYFDYANDRKVQNRKDKVKQRLGYTFYAKDFDTNNYILSDDKTNCIICGDSEQVLKQYPDNCIDLIFTSPPYNFGLNYNQHNDTSTWSEYFDKLFRVFDECIRVLKYGGRFVINIQPMYSDYIPAHHLISNYLFSHGLIWKSEILWEKNNYNCKYTAWGSWKSPSNPYMKYTWEFIEVFCKGTLKKEGKDSDLTAEEFKEWVIAKWSIAPERHMKKFDHPAMFPEKLAYRTIKLFSFPNDIILDPFNGAGTTTYVAKILKRKYIGIDISAQYCKTSEERLHINNLFNIK